MTTDPLVRPKPPQTFVYANCTFQIERDNELFDYLEAEFSLDVGMFIEVRHSRRVPVKRRHMNLHEHFPVHWYEINQTENDFNKGSAGIVALKETVPYHVELRGGIASRAMESVGLRPWRESLVRTRQGYVHVLVSHRPLRKNRMARKMWDFRMARRIKWLNKHGRKWVFACDTNGETAMLARLFNCHFEGRGIDAVFHAKHLELSNVRVDATHKGDGKRPEEYTDHYVIAFDL